MCCTDQKWWQDKVAAEKAKAQANQPPPASNKPQPAAARGRGAGPVRSRGRGAAAPTARGGRGAAKVAPASTRGRGAASTRGSKTNVATAPTGHAKCEKNQEVAKPTIEETKVSVFICLKDLNCLITLL